MGHHMIFRAEQGRFRRLYAVVFVGLVGLAAFLRLHDLEARPMHGDEANQAVKAGILHDSGKYHYDPFEHHGPTLYYLTLPVLWVSGVKDFAESRECQYRLVPALFGIGLVGLLWWWRNALGRGAILWAALFVAISHGMVFYSRYYIQETLFVFFVYAAIAAGAHALRTKRMHAFVLLGVLVGLAQATKETFLVAAAAAVCALLWTGIHARWHRVPLTAARGIGAGTVLAGLVAMVAVSVLFYSSFFSHARGPLDSLLTYTRYLGRAEGAGSSAMHDKPWYYYFQVILYTYQSAGPRWSEALVFALAMLGLIPSLWPKMPKAGNGSTLADLHLRVFLAMFTLILMVVFSCIPYKTPWNILIFFYGLILFAGLGAAWLVRVFSYMPVRVVVCALLLGGTIHAAHQTWLGTTVYAADTRNPYVYAHTSTAVKRLALRMEELAAVHPAGRDLRIYVIEPNGDYWPLPWYLRRFGQVGYFPACPNPADAPVIIASPKLRETLNPLLGEKYHMECHALRPSALLDVYIEKGLWDAFIATRSTPAAADEKKSHCTEIARGQSWVSPYWGYSSPKLVFDGASYFTAGLWGGVDAAEGVVYRLDGATWRSGAKLSGIYQPASLLLDPQKRLLVTYARMKAPPRILRAHVSGEIDAFDELPTPPDVTTAYYLGVGVWQSTFYLAYIDATYGMRLSRLNLDTLEWEPSILLEPGQTAVKPKTAWTYPILVPTAEGLYLAASNSPDGGEGNSYNEVWCLFLPSGAATPVWRERVAESIIGYNSYAMDMARTTDGALHLLYLWNTHSYGDPLPEGSGMPGTYHAVRQGGASGWQAQWLTTECYGGFFQRADRLWAVMSEGGAIIAHPWQDAGRTWGAGETLFTAAELPVFPGFIDLMSASSGSMSTSAPAFVADGMLPAPVGEPQSRLLWGAFPKP